VHPPVGPLDLAKIPKPLTIEPLTTNWTVGAGKATSDKKSLSIDNNGAPYWLVSKSDLPTNFQITFPCAVGFLKGGQMIWDSQESILRSLVFRFASPDTKTAILERKGYLIQFSAELMWLYREGKKNGDAVAVSNIGNPDEPMVFAVTFNHGVLKVAVDGKEMLTFKDPKPLSAKHKFCIGGYLSQLVIGPVQIVDLDAPTGAKPVAASQPAATPLPSN
jgi:serine protease Do